MTAAVGYAAESGIPFRFGLIRNHYVGRTFIEPSQSVRDFGVKLKLNPVRSLLEGKRVVLIDDSIVRGTTSRKIVRMIRSAGAKEVHMRISCPPTISPCYYGVDTPSKNQLIAANKSVDEIRDYIRRRFAGLSFARRTEESLRRRRENFLLFGLLHRQISYEHCGRGRNTACGCSALSLFPRLNHARDRLQIRPDVELRSNPCSSRFTSSAIVPLISMTSQPPGLSAASRLRNQTRDHFRPVGPAKTALRGSNLRTSSWT